MLGLHSSVMWVLPDYNKNGPAFSSIMSGYCSCTNVPNVLSLSTIQYSARLGFSNVNFLIMECSRDTEMSSAILTSQEVLRPSYSSDLFSVFKMKNNFDLVNSSF